MMNELLAPLLLGFGRGFLLGLLFLGFGCGNDRLRLLLLGLGGRRNCGRSSILLIIRLGVLLFFGFNRRRRSGRWRFDDLRRQVGLRVLDGVRVAAIGNDAGRFDFDIRLRAHIAATVFNVIDL